MSGEQQPYPFRAPEQGQEPSWQPPPQVRRPGDGSVPGQGHPGATLAGAAPAGGVPTGSVPTSVPPSAGVPGVGAGVGPLTGVGPAVGGPVGHPAPPGHPGGGWPGGGWLPRNELGTAALVVGIIGAVLSCTFVLSPIALVLGVLALGLGIAGLGRTRSGEATNRVAALGGVWTGAGATALGAVLSVVLLVWSSQPIEVESEAGSDVFAEDGDTVFYEDGLVVVVTAPEPSADGAFVTVTAEMTNDGDESVDLQDGELVAHADGDRLDSGEVRRSSPEPGAVAPGETDTVTYTVTVPGGTEELGIDLAPGEDHELSYWVFTVPGPGGAGGGDGGGEDGPGINA
ncbi:hypothetical protein ACTWP5_16170 [Streptomyces sp. 4N509B]|uniref:hypothetical protein n=1 Tax=Streptomyces sp. 4N509B TaxID=3457413 RepID=UPI003FD48D97